MSSAKQLAASASLLVRTGLSRSSWFAMVSATKSKPMNAAAAPELATKRFV
jgi:hypothetical protein